MQANRLCYYSKTVNITIKGTIEREREIGFFHFSFFMVFVVAGLTIAISKNPITESTDSVNIILSANESIHVYLLK